MIESFRCYRWIALRAFCPPVDLLGQEGKPYALFQCTYGALYQALNAISPRSTACLPARLDVSEPGVDAAGDLYEDVSRIGILQFGRLLAGVAYMSAEGQYASSAVRLATTCAVPSAMPPSCTMRAAIRFASSSTLWATSP